MNTNSSEEIKIADIQAAPKEDQQKPLPSVDVEEEPAPEVSQADAKAPIKVEIPPRAVERQLDSAGIQKEDDGIVRISNKAKSYRSQIGYLMSRLNNGKTATLQAYGYAVNRAILLSSIIRTKLGDIHQTITLCELKEDKRETQGIRIFLSKEAPADTSDVGYQEPEPKGFWQRKRSFRKEQKPKEKLSKKQSDNKTDKKDEKKTSDVDEDAHNKSVARSSSKRRRSQSGRKAADLATKDKPAVLSEAKLAKTESTSPARSRRDSRRRRPSTKAAAPESKALEPTEVQKRKQSVKKAPAADEDKDAKPRVKSQRNSRRANESRSSVKKDNDTSVNDQKENIKVVQAKSSEKKGARASNKDKADATEGSKDARESKQTSFKKSWADDEIQEFFYEGGQARRKPDNREQPQRRGRGNYQGGGAMGRRPPQYSTYDYPPMRGPYFPGQDYYMMRPSYQQQYRSYYNQPGYQKGHGTREIGQKGLGGYQGQRQRGSAEHDDQSTHQRRAAGTGAEHGARENATHSGGGSGYQQRGEQRGAREIGQNYLQPSSHGGQHEASGHFGGVY